MTAPSHLPRRLRASTLTRVGLTAAVSILVVAGACVAPPPNSRYLDPIFDVTVRQDIVYGHATDFQGHAVDLLLDLYTPTGDTAANRPAVIYAHGGGFTSGTKSEAGFSRTLAQRGYVTASISYRLRPGTNISFGNPDNPDAINAVVDAIHDGQTAIRWFRAHAGDLGIDPARVAFSGSSAGAVMAVGISLLSDSVDGTEGSPGFSSRACLTVANAGALLPGLASADDTPALFFHGTEDRTVPYSLGLQTEQALVAAGVPAAFYSFPGVGHVVPGDQVLPKLIPILKAQVADGNCSKWL